ncbi:hypothetical protein FHX34_105695 [Actinoplanes teichomyceticus]|uniref:Uncharacterized protein n=2 Tax=Actinoplanes teichomyceticus TaxID=1867 RepID=A0A561VMJ6_ACTTI|nr:hypothetical protein FHX34_105695 [Actinoplanes teichomyceticus]GIF13572.1 hypothetical protein Ate01nite_36040 [Actinoplanes teichomyceticus]
MHSNDRQIAVEVLSILHLHRDMRICLRYLAALVAVVAAGLVSPASAQAASGLKVSEAVIQSLTAQAIVPSWATNTIGNASAIGIGVIGAKDGNYNVPNKYDYVLPVNMYTHDRFGWNTTGGFYTGPNYCTWQLRSDDHGVTWYRQYPDLGSGVHLIGANTSYIVTSYSC